MIIAMLAELVYIQLADLADSNDTLLVQLACPACPACPVSVNLVRKTIYLYIYIVNLLSLLIVPMFSMYCQTKLNGLVE